MRGGLIVGGVLGLGCAAVFALAGVAAVAFPSGATVAGSPPGWAPDGFRAIDLPADVRRRLPLLLPDDAVAIPAGGVVLMPTPPPEP